MMAWLEPHEWSMLWTLAGCIVLFDAWERLKPARPPARAAELHLDVLAFCAVIGFKYFIEGRADAGVGRLAAWVARSPLAVLAAMPTWGKIPVSLVLLDFTLYWIHRAQHELRWLWPTHVWHHTIHHLYWLSMFRVSLVHLAFYAAPQAAIMLLFGMTTREVAIGSIIAVTFDFWVHSNIVAPLGPLEGHLVTPQYHRIHHAADARMDRNLSFAFTWWDRLFGTWADPRTTPDDFRL